MEAKKVIGTVLIALGALGLIVGVMGVFESGAQVGSLSAWPLAILGGIFFVAGIGLLKSVSKGDAPVA